jgi:uncharacterized protein YecT (DUF1311 family)
MPCRCPEDDYPREDAADKATRAGCDMRTIIRRHNLEKELTVETRAWIKKHDAEDARRIAEENASGLREKVKQQALDKLSLEERRVLGL